MAIPEKCPRCGGDMLQFQDGETWYCMNSTEEWRDPSMKRCRFQYHPTRKDIIEMLKEEFPDPPPPVGRPVFGEADPRKYIPTDWEKEVPDFKGRAL